MLKLMPLSHGDSGCGIFFEMYLLVLIYLIKIWVSHVLRLGSEVQAYHWYRFIISKCDYDMC